MADIPDDELLSIVADERRRSIGFDHDEDLSSAREKALNYNKGEMPDVPAMANRSKAVSTDVSDALQTVLPDLMEIFAGGGEDVIAFAPQGPEDEEAAQQETDYIQHVFFDENDGWLTLYSMMNDALLQKTGVSKTWWDDYEKADEQKFEGKAPEEYAVAMAGAEAGGYEVVDAQQDEMGGVSFTVRQTVKTGCARAMSVPPDDFAWARDTVILSDTVYCAMRSRPRAQSLIADGYDAELVNRLPAYGTPHDDSLTLARDTAGEHNSGIDAGGIGDLRTVEIIEHYVRVGKTLYKVVTGGGEAILLDKEEVERIPFALITPFPVPHRLAGRSLADLLLEVQRIKTALTRMFLDSGYFALNQRMEVASERSNAFTISDLLRNEPGVPVRSKTGDAVRAISAGALDFDALAALEHFSTVAEGRTGIVRNAQGLNPDTLHDTAKGAMALMTAAQKRVRLIARIFAETGLKDMFLQLHALIRTHATQKAKVRLRNKWVDIDPTSWGERNDMRIELGLGAGGRDHDMMMLTQQMGMLEQLVAVQGGTLGPLFNAKNAYNFARRFMEKTGSKNPEMFISEPPEQDPNAPPPPPPPDPKLVEVQQKGQLAQQQAQAAAQLEEAKAGHAAQLQTQQAQVDAQTAQQRLDAEMGLKRYQIDAEMGLKREQLTAELVLKREQLAAELELKREQIGHDMALKGAQAEHAASLAETKVSSDVHTGGEPG